jgi:ABC-type bacteriocin/lantibiotic exporter with double-glycine peptidase domain
MLTWYAQEQATSCVAACIRMVLTGFSQTLPEMPIRQMIGTPKLGISLVTAVARLNQHGAISQAHEDWNLEDIRDAIREGHFLIVGVERHLLGYPPASHAVVVVNVTSSGVEILDPLDGPQPKQFGLSAFQQAWIHAGQEALIIEAPPTNNEEGK